MDDLSQCSEGLVDVGSLLKRGGGGGRERKRREKERVEGQRRKGEGEALNVKLQ